MSTSVDVGVKRNAELSRYCVEAFGGKLVKPCNLVSGELAAAVLMVVSPRFEFFYALLHG